MDAGWLISWNVVGGCHSHEMEDGDSHLPFGGSVLGDGSSSLQISGAASWEVGRFNVSAVCLPHCQKSPPPTYPSNHLPPILLFLIFSLLAVNCSPLSGIASVPLKTAGCKPLSKECSECWLHFHLFWNFLLFWKYWESFSLIRLWTFSISK